MILSYLPYPEGGDVSAPSQALPPQLESCLRVQSAVLPSWSSAWERSQAFFAQPSLVFLYELPEPNTASDVIPACYRRQSMFLHTAVFSTYF